MTSAGRPDPFPAQEGAQGSIFFPCSSPAAGLSTCSSAGTALRGGCCAAGPVMWVAMGREGEGAQGRVGAGTCPNSRMEAFCLHSPSARGLRSGGRCACCAGRRWSCPFWPLESSRAGLSVKETNKLDLCFGTPSGQACAVCTRTKAMSGSHCT